jgi:prevent-host-death family protein
MKSISLLQFRRQAEAIVRQVQQGQTFLLTYRGKPVARLEPVRDPSVSGGDSIYDLADLASDTAQPLTNDQIDQAAYGA